VSEKLKRIEDVRQLAGKVVSSARMYGNHAAIIFTDETYISLSAVFGGADDADLETDAILYPTTRYRLGIIPQAEFDAIKEAERVKRESTLREREVKLLAELKAKYPEA